MLAVFNKQTDKFLFFADHTNSHISLNEKYNVKDVGPINPWLDTYYGGFETGNVLRYGSPEHTELLAVDADYDEKNVISERKLRDEVAQRIVYKHHYSLERKVDILIDMLNKGNVPHKTPEFERMVKVLDVENKHLKESLDVYASDSSFKLIREGEEQDFITQQVQDELLNNL